MVSKIFSDNARLKTDELFGGLTSKEREVLNSAGITHFYKKGEIIFREYGLPAGIFYIKSGRVKKFKSVEGGGEQIIYICSEGDVLGYHALLAEEYYSDSAAVMEDSFITFIPKEVFLKVLHNSTTLSNRLLKAVSHEFALYINGLTTLATKTVRERLALNLLMLEEKFKTPSKRQIEINISRGDLASIVGTAKETVVRLLRDFKDKEFIQAKGQSILIKDRKALSIAARIDHGSSW